MPSISLCLCVVPFFFQSLSTLCMILFRFKGCIVVIGTVSEKMSHRNLGRFMDKTRLVHIK